MKKISTFIIELNEEFVDLKKKFFLNLILLDQLLLVLVLKLD
jgi:hypothetical protein